MIWKYWIQARQSLSNLRNEDGYVYKGDFSALPSFIVSKTENTIVLKDIVDFSDIRFITPDGETSAYDMERLYTDFDGEHLLTTFKLIGRYNRNDPKFDEMEIELMLLSEAKIVTMWFYQSKSILLHPGVLQPSPFLLDITVANPDAGSTTTIEVDNPMPGNFVLDGEIKVYQGNIPYYGFTTSYDSTTNKIEVTRSHDTANPAPTDFILHIPFKFQSYDGSPTLLWNYFYRRNDSVENILWDMYYLQTFKSDLEEELIRTRTGYRFALTDPTKHNLISDYVFPGTIPNYPGAVIVCDSQTTASNEIKIDGIVEPGLYFGLRPKVTIPLFTAVSENNTDYIRGIFLDDIKYTLSSANVTITLDDASPYKGSQWHYRVYLEDSESEITVYDKLVEQNISGSVITITVPEVSFYIHDKKYYTLKAELWATTVDITSDAKTINYRFIWNSEAQMIGGSDLIASAIFITNINERCKVSAERDGISVEVYNG